MSLDTAPKLTRKRILAFGLQTATSTPATLAAADAVTNVFGGVPIIKYTTEKVDREQMGGLSPIQQARGARSGTATFETELVGNGASGAAIWTRLLQACGYANTAGTWAPVDGNTQVLTIGEWIDGKLKLLSDCMGTFTITLRRGQKGRIRWQFTGVRQPSIDSANLTPTFVATKAPRCGLSAFSLANETTLRMPEVSIDAGNEVILREDVTAVDTNGDPTGYRTAYITGRKPMIKVAPESLPIATIDWDTLYQTLALSSFTTQVGVSANNTFVIAAPKLQIDSDPTDEDRNRMLATGLELLCTRNSSAGMDELTLTQS